MLDEVQTVSCPSASFAGNLPLRRPLPGCREFGGLAGDDTPPPHGLDGVRHSAEHWMPMVQHIVLKRMHHSAILMHMRTTLNIDDALLGRATELSGLKEKTAVVRAGLKALVAQESARRLAALGGTERGVRRIRRRRPRPLAAK